MCLFSGVALDSPDGKDVSIVKKSGKVKALEDEITSRKFTQIMNAYLVVEN